MNEEALLSRAKDLKLYGLIAHWDEIPSSHLGFLEQLRFPAQVDHPR